MEEISQSETSHLSSLEEEKSQEAQEAPEGGKDAPMTMGDEHNPPDRVDSNEVVEQSPSYSEDKQEEDNLDDVELPEETPKENEVEGKQETEFDKHKGDVEKQPDLDTQEGPDNKSEDRPDLTEERPDEEEEEESILEEEEERHKSEKELDNPEKERDNVEEELRLLEKEAEAEVDQEKQDNPEEVEDKPEKEDDKLEVEENKPEEEEDITEEGEDKTEEEEDKAEIEKDKPEEEENKQEEELDKAKEQDKPRKKEDEVKNPAVEESSENPRNEMQEEDDVEIHPDKKDESKESDESKKSTNEEKVTDLEKLEKEDDNSETRKDTKTGEDPNETVFEEVDANVSDEKEGNADESDMLGDSDMTVPEDNEDGKDVLDDAATDADKATTMEVDCLSSNDDVEMVSPADNEPSDPKEKEGISEEHEESALEVEKSPSNQNEDEPMEGEPEETPTDTPAEGGEDVVDTTDDKQTQETIEIPDVTEEEKEKLDSEKASNKDAKTISELRCDDEADIDDEDGNQRSQIEDDDAAAPSNDTDVVEIESESNDLTEVADSSTNREDDANIENVQEPEESDVCLIPDTDTEMTEDEKERAIQARENAEKEGELAEEAAEAAAKNPESAPEEAPQEPEQEPLLEEMQAPVPATTGGPTPHKTIIFLAVSAPNTCAHCKEEKVCGYRFKEADKTTTEHLCEISCVDQYLAANPGKYFLRRKKFLVEEVPEAGNDVEHECLQCKNTISRNKYFFKQDDATFYICSEDCYKVLSSDEPEKFNLKRDSIRVRNIGHTTISSKGSNSSDSNRIVSRSAAEAEAAKLERTTSFLRRCVDCQSHIRVIPNDKSLVWQAMDFCHELCLGKYQRRIGSNCQTCKGEVPHQSLGKYCVRFGFEVRQFCCATCLNNFKKGLKTCSCCQKDISGSGEGFLAPVGDKEQFKDFCSQTCMRRYDAMCNAKKKLRTDHCGVCNFEKQMRVEMTIDGNEHNFCSNPCFSAFKFVSNIVPDQCAMCSKYFERKSGECFTIYGDKQRPKVFCSRICFNVYIIVNRQITSCQWCKVKKYDFDMIMKIVDQRQIMMCSLNCLTLYGVSLNAFSRASVKCDNCNSCVTPQYHLTMSDASMRNFCTYQCVMQFQSQFARVPLTLDSEAVAAATHHVKQKAAAAVSTPVAPFPTGLPKRVKLNVSQPQNAGQVSTATGTETNINIVNSQNSGLLSVMPVISNVASLAPGQNERLGQSSLLKRGVGPRGRGRAKKIMNERPARIPSPPPVPPITRTRSTSSPILAPASASQPIVSNKSTRGGRTSSRTTATHTPSESPRPPSPIIEKQIETKIVTVPPYPPLVRNVQTSCHPKTDDASVDCRPETAEIGIQTDEDFSSKILIPVPVPIFVPQPMYMYSAPFPVPVPIPLPIPVPIFIPTTRNSSSGILKEIKKIQDKMPADPFEAELLMMAEMVADEKNESDSDSEEDMKPEPRMIQVQYESPTAGQTNNVVVNIEPQNNSSFGEDVLQMALKMASGDYEEPGVDLESAMTTNTITNPPPGMIQDDSGMQMSHHHMMMEQPQRGGRGRKRGAIATPVTPRNNRSPIKRQRLSVDSTPPQMPVQPAEKPDANMCLKFTFGVNAWKQWVMTKNADIEKSSIRRRLFKTELLQMTADELNYSLCLFVKEVRKPNGTEYAPDTIYYLVLGIQQYLYENGRIDNIFTDPYYERFTDCLDEVARKFSVLYNDSQYIVTRVEEEHLWECKQLGAHSPHVLLSTLMFFNTKHFNLTNVEEHMQLSFSHIMKHWKRSAQNTKSPGTRNVLLRFYPPQAGLDANPRKKKVYEQQENEENPLRCPVRLYEFYLSKCPESVKTRNDVFYLQPERSCVPDSPVWYSTQALGEENLQKMLHRVKMVKEINIALLTS